jgi:CelD/BcsL family acetyltransferase involved in cellulose biosynthesis
MWRVEERRGREALESLAGEWRELEARCRRATAFQSPEWLIPWWTCFAHGEVRVMTVWRGSQLCALLPVLVEPGGDGNRFTLLGTGNTDHLDMLVDDRCRDVAAAMAIDAVAQCLSEHDWCDFEQLPASSPIMSTPAPFGWCWEAEQCDVCPTLTITACAGDDLLPPRRASEARYAERRLARLGVVEIDIVRRDNLAEALAALFALHEARWQARCLPGVLGPESVRRFLARVADGFLDRGMLRLYTLCIDRRIVAVHYGFQYRGRRYYYIGGFDPELASFSVGTALLAHAIRDAAKEGTNDFDFLRGAESYKYRWGAHDEASYRRVLRKWNGTGAAETTCRR